MAGAGALLGEISVQYPRDLLALFVGHQIDFFTGDAVNLRDRIGRALGAWGDRRPAARLRARHVRLRAGGVQPLRPVGRRRASARWSTNPDDVWGIHAVVHTYEMQGQIPDGVRFMRDRERATGRRATSSTCTTPGTTRSTCCRAGDPPGALAVYDRVLHHDGSEDVALELLDATALLWRLWLEGIAVGDRWRPLAQAWARLLTPGFYPFNDMHAIMAFIGDGELDRAGEVVAALERVVGRHGRPGPTTGWAMTSAVGLPVCRSLVHFGRGSYERVLDELLPIRTRVHEFGGSHAQRDAVERTLLEAAIRAGRTDLARALVSERLAVRECSTYAWSKRASMLAATGDQPGAASAAARASELAGKIRAAADGPLASDGSGDSDTSGAG